MINKYTYLPDQANNYYLLPFHFHRFNEKEILVNMIGDYLIVAKGTAERIVNKEVDHNEAIYEDLIASFFISDTIIPDLINVISTRYRTKKSFLFDFTSLHIFVMTLRCNHTCNYCQVSQKSIGKNEYDISYDDLDDSIKLMFNSPSKNLTMEFQGGEPLLVFEKIKYAVTQVNKFNLTENRNIQFVLCTNLCEITEEQLDYCKENKIQISTSYDGPEYIHNFNRKISNSDSHKMTINGITKCRSKLGFDSISALLTVSRFSLNYPIEIIDDYIKQGFTSIFLRPINPFGTALLNSARVDYDIDLFISFYKIALKYILELNHNGTHIVEEYATIILKHILTPFHSGFTDLQSPNGVISSVLIYNYDGYVYPSDESRMIAEQGDYFFRLGHVKQDKYEDIIYSDKVKELTKAWSNESIPGCSECAFQIYCGTDPVRNYSMQGNLIGLRPSNSFCKKNMSIIEFLFELMDKDERNEILFRKWVSN